MAHESVFDGIIIEGVPSSGTSFPTMTRDPSTGLLCLGVVPLTAALPSGQVFVGNGSGVATPRAISGVIAISNTGVSSFAAGSIINADINATAGIARTKLASGSANRVVVNNASGVMIDAAAITPARVLISDANGIPVATAYGITVLDNVASLLSPAQAQINTKLTVSLTSPAQGAMLQFNGTDWVNFGIGTAGQVITSDGLNAVWGNAAANGLPVGGTTNQYLRKINGTNYNTEWHTLALADITDVTATATELNTLQGLDTATVSSTILNFLGGSNPLGSSVQNQLDSKLDNNLAYHAIWVGAASNTAQQVSPGANGTILTIVAGHPTWQSPSAPGDVSGPVSSTDNAIVRWNSTGGDVIQNSGVLVDDNNFMIFPTATGIRTSTSAGNTLLFQAYDVDGAAYTTFATLTANNTPTFDLSSAVTIGGAVIYRVGGTDVSLADGGTGASLADPGGFRLLAWDDIDNAVTFINIGATLTYTSSTHTLDAVGSPGSFWNTSGTTTLLGDVIINGGVHQFLMNNTTNATFVIDTDFAATAGGNIYLEAGGGLSIFSLTSGGAAAISANTDFSVSTNGALRFTVESDGSWNVGGSNGTAGQVLTSNGSAAAPTWQASGGGGISGLTTNRIPYATSSTTIGDDPALTWNPTNNILIVGSASIYTPVDATNLFIGSSAGNLTLTGNHNIGIGTSVGASLTSAIRNVAIGGSSLVGSTSGGGNVAIGYSAMSISTTSDDNVIIGSGAGSDLTTGDRNVFIGATIGGITTGSGNVLIGNQLTAQSASADGQLSIQNIIFGQGNSGTGTTVSSGNLGLYATSWGTSAVKVISLGNGTAPTTSPANLIQCYSESGIFKYRDSSGNIITI